MLSVMRIGVDGIVLRTSHAKGSLCISLALLAGQIYRSSTH